MRSRSSKANITSNSIVDDDLLIQAQVLRDKHFEYKKADLTFAEFQYNQDFIKLKEKAINKKEFLRNVEAQILCYWD